MLPRLASGIDLGLDLGTATTTLVTRDDIVFREPSCVALRGRDVAAVGLEARKMMGRVDGSTRVVRPLSAGVVHAFQEAQRMLEGILRRVRGRWSRPHVLLSVPVDLTDVERRALQDCVRSAGAGSLSTIASPLALGVGAELPVRDPVGHAVADLGAGRVSGAVLSLGGIVVSGSTRVGGDAMDEAIDQYLRQHHGLAVGDRTLSTLKVQVGAAARVDDPQRLRVRGRDLALGSPRELEVDANEIAEACHPVVSRIVETLHDVLRETPPELASDLVDRGIVVSGGVAGLRHLDAVLRQALSLPIVVLDDLALARGLQRVMTEPELAALAHKA